VIRYAWCILLAVIFFPQPAPAQLANSMSPANAIIGGATPSADAFALPSPPQPAIPGGGATSRDSKNEPYDLFATYPWQASFEYTFIRSYSVATSKPNTNGFSFGMAYYIKTYLAAEGELDATFGNQFGYSARFAFTGGGVRARLPSSQHWEPWAHGLIGGVHWTPQLANSKQESFAWELGGGVDYRTRSWLSYRIEGDAIGTHFRNSNQVSPRISAGIVLNF
jgi:hypothetical protein